MSMQKEICDDFKVKLTKLKELKGILGSKKITRDNIDDIWVIFEAMWNIINEFRVFFLRAEYSKWYRHFGIKSENILEQVIEDQIEFDLDHYQAIFRGHLQVDEDMKYLPSHLKIEGDLEITNPNLFVIPDDLIVIGDVFIHRRKGFKTVLEKIKELKSKGQIEGKILL